MKLKNMSLKLQFSIAVALIMIIITIPASLLSQKAVEELFKSVSAKYIDEIIFLVENDIRNIMLSGHGKDIYRQIEALNTAFPSVRIQIFKGEPPENKEGEIRKPFQTEQYITVMASSECVKCHTRGGKIATMKITFRDPSFKAFLTHTRYFILGFSIISIVLMFLIIFIYFSLYMDRPLKNIVKVFGEVERENLKARVNEKTAGSKELLVIMKGINKTLDALEKFLKEKEEEFSTQIQRADRLATVGELASAIAHEIKNPLAGISGALQVLREEIKLEEKTLEVFDEIMNQISRVSKTINDLLSLAREVKPEFDTVNIHQLLDSLLVLVEQQAKKQRVEIIKKYDPDLPYVMGDAEKLQQVFLNIMLNAIQAMPDGGTLTIQTEALFLENEKVKVKITDTGEGIKEEYMERIFEPFFTTKPKGTGLGMFTAKRIVELHGGKIGIKSEVGKGTEVVVVIPVRHTSS